MSYEMICSLIYFQYCTVNRVLYGIYENFSCNFTNEWLIDAVHPKCFDEEELKLAYSLTNIQELLKFLKSFYLLAFLFFQSFIFFIYVLTILK